MRHGHSELKKTHRVGQLEKRVAPGSVLPSAVPHPQVSFSRRHHWSCGQGLFWHRCGHEYPWHERRGGEDREKGTCRVSGCAKGSQTDENGQGQQVTGRWGHRHRAKGTDPLCLPQDGLLVLEQSVQTTQMSGPWTVEFKASCPKPDLIDTVDQIILGCDGLCFLGSSSTYTL